MKSIRKRLSWLEGVRAATARKLFPGSGAGFGTRQEAELLELGEDTRNSEDSWIRSIGIGAELPVSKFVEPQKFEKK